MKHQHSENNASTLICGVVSLVIAVVTCAAPMHAQAQGELEQQTYPIDLPTALRLAKAQNYKIAIAKERISEANARLDQSRILMVPTLTFGTSYSRQDGPLQATDGRILDVDRGSSFTGLGAGAVGAGQVQVSGISVEADLARALFEPLAARQSVLAAKADSRVRTNQVLLDVATTYYELARAKATLAIADESYRNATDLAKVTKSFADSGEGLDSDAERAAVEQLVREREFEGAREALQVQSVRLAELLHLDVRIRLDPLDTDIAPTEIVTSERSVSELMDSALQNHPEVAQDHALAELARQRMKQAKYSHVLPKLSLNYSAGGFRGGRGSSLGGADRRSDISAMIYWQFDHLGFGHKARDRERQSAYRQAELEKLETLDRIASEVNQAHTQVQTREKQISIGSAAVERALRSFELNRTRIYEKQGLPVEALQSIQSLAITRKHYLDSVIDYNQAQFRLFTALGQPRGDEQ